MKNTNAKEPVIGADDLIIPKAWYAAAWSKEIKRDPVKRRIVGKDIVLFRDQSGTSHALQAFCPHRGADLSLGRCVGDHLQCCYHGWEFSGDGTCRLIPAHPDRPVPHFAHASAYPVMEKAGLVWIYPVPLPAPPPPFELFPELDDPGYAFGPYDAAWTAHITRVVESVLDVAHLAFVHKKTIGKHQQKEVEDLQFDADEDVIRIFKNHVRFEYRFPQHWIQRVGEKGSLMTYLTFTPVDRDKTVIFGMLGRRFLRSIPGISWYFSRFSERVLKEDQAVVESQHPRPIPEALRMEAHVPSDGPQVRFRQQWYQMMTDPESHIRID